MKDLINFTYSMKGLSLITDFEAYGKKVLAEGNCRILPYGVFVM